MFPKKKRIVDRDACRKYDNKHLYCEMPDCEAPRWLGSHHIRFKSQGGSDVPENLFALCKTHHDWAHGPSSRKAREEILKLKESS